MEKNEYAYFQKHAIRKIPYYFLISEEEKKKKSIDFYR
jgi:hypothetical protein